MATDAPVKPITDPQRRRGGDQSNYGGTFVSVLKPLASLKLTVVLFALSVFIVLAGTLAQAESDIWTVINTYFRVDTTRLFSSTFPYFHVGELFVKIPLKIFAPESFFHGNYRSEAWFPFPKGWVIGLVMAFNLVAAHTVRFKTQAKGQNLLIGWLVLAMGALVTWGVVLSGSNHDGMQNEFSVSWKTVWHLLQFGTLALWLGLGYVCVARRSFDRLGASLTLVSMLLLAPLLVWMLWSGGDVPLDSSGMRILWQLIKGFGAGLVLLAGCVILFRKRAGIVLLHGGIGLMMFYEVLVGVSAEEGLMQIPEGQTVNFVRDARTAELAVLRDLNEQEQHVTVIPHDVIRDHVPRYKTVKKTDTDGRTTTEDVIEDEGTFIQHDELPFDIRFDHFFVNSRVLDSAPRDKTLATKGLGVTNDLQPMAQSSGASSDAKVDTPGAYVTLTRKGKPDEVLGKYMLYSGFDLQQFVPSLFEFCYQPVEVDGETYQIGLRYTRRYKPYEITLKDVRAKFYEASSIPRDYSSDVVLHDFETGTKQEATLWMNNPLRFGGETFYQQGYAQLTRDLEMTTLQVVTNTGWMVPYVSCMIVLVGMLAQFLMTLQRFLKRRADAALAGGVEVDEPDAPIFDLPAKPKGKQPVKALPPLSASHSPVATWTPIAVSGVLIAWMAMHLFVPRSPSDEFDLRAFGQIPIRDEGRIKPLDTYVRNTLKFFTNGRTEFKDRSGDTQPAIRFFIDLMKHAKPQPGLQPEGVNLPWRASDSYRVFKIENHEVQKRLDLPKVEKDLYAFNDLRPYWPKIAREVSATERPAQENISSSERVGNLKLQELGRKLLTYNKAIDAFDVDLEFFSRIDSIQADQQGIQFMQQVVRMFSSMEQSAKDRNFPQMIPDLNEKPDSTKFTDEWQPLPVALFEHQLTRTLQGGDGHPLAGSLLKAMRAYDLGSVGEFNVSVREYLARVAGDPPPSLDLSRVRFEHYFNNTNLYYYAAVVSIVAFILGALAWLLDFDALRRSSYWLLAALFVVHTFGLIARIYISGRPPVTNLYSSAIFIGWGAVGLGLLLEWIYSIGIAVVIANFVSFATLLIAHFLSIGEDTIGVLQAVLDTQFWLATHVVCITFGYTTTFLAGFMGVAYVLRGMVTPTLSSRIAGDLSRMIYGTLCFSILFSFVGTVLGGLWADDSWGRFWGWDPKENGALIIVLWNALVLHARWGGMVKDRGMAILAMGGNIATAWSWFGVNQLGVGLHSYGFTTGVLEWLGILTLLHLALIIVAAVYPQKDWWSFRRERFLNASK